MELSGFIYNVQKTQIIIWYDKETKKVWFRLASDVKKSFLRFVSCFSRNVVFKKKKNQFTA